MPEGLDFSFGKQGGFMDFRDLNYILAIAQYQNISKAAEALYVTQPTLSKFLINTERNLGQKLFRKMGHKYILTYAGERYVETAKEILQLKSNLDYELNDILKNDVGVLNVAFARMRCTYMLSETLPDFHKLHPNVKVNIFEGSSDENDQRLLDGTAELAFYSMPDTPNPLLDYETIEEEELLICLPKDHPLGKLATPNPHSKYPKLDPALLKDELVLQLTTKQRTRQILDSYLNSIGLRYENVMETSSIAAIMELVSVGYGVSFMFEPHLRKHSFKYPIDCYSFGDSRLVANFVAAHRHGAYLPAYAHDFIDLVRKVSH